jgi:hypothetical protein
MSPNLESAGLRGAQFQAVFGRSRSAEIGWDLWGFLPQSLPRRFRATSLMTVTTPTANQR